MTTNKRLAATKKLEKRPTATPEQEAMYQAYLNELMDRSEQINDRYNQAVQQMKSRVPSNIPEGVAYKGLQPWDAPSTPVSGGPAIQAPHINKPIVRPATTGERLSMGLKAFGRDVGEGAENAVQNIGNVGRAVGEGAEASVSKLMNIWNQLTGNK